MNRGVTESAGQYVYFLNAGDTLTLECTWDNPTDSDVAWGEGTSDEMCLGITLNTAQE